MEKINLCRIMFGFLPGVGGSITHTVELSRQIAPYLNRQIILTQKSDEDTTSIDSALPFEVYRIQYCKFKSLAKIKQKFLPWLPVAPLIHFSFGVNAIKKTIALNKTHGIDIIQAHGIGAGPVARIAGCIIKKPVVWMLHGTLLAYSQVGGFYETLLTKLFKPHHMFILDDGSQAPIKFTKMLYSRVTIVFHAIDADKFKPAPKPFYLLEELNIPKNSFIIFSPHSLIPVKGQEYAIRGFNNFLRNANKKNVFLIIAGSGILRKGLEVLAEELGVKASIIFVKAIPNSKMTDYYALSDIVLATSLYSNMNRSTQEAMACAKPVIAFNSGGTSRIITSGQTGLLAESGNSEALSQQIKQLWDNEELRKALGKNARDFITEKRSWESRIKIELDVYDKLLFKKQP